MLYDNICILKAIQIETQNKELILFTSTLEREQCERISPLQKVLPAISAIPCQ